MCEQESETETETCHRKYWYTDISKPLFSRHPLLSEKLVTNLMSCQGFEGYPELHVGWHGKFGLLLNRYTQVTVGQFNLNRISLLQSCTYSLGKKFRSFLSWYQRNIQQYVQVKSTFAVDVVSLSIHTCNKLCQGKWGRMVLLKPLVNTVNSQQRRVQS